MAGLTLAMDAAGGDGTIAVLRSATLLDARTVVMRSADEERFLPAVLAAITSAGGTPRDIARIICGEGPGSFTALRVVGAVGKGLAVGLGIPLHAVPSLALMVGASEATRGGGRFLAVLDALREERYLALVTVGRGGSVTAVESLGLAPAAAIGERSAALGARRIGAREEVDGAPHARGVVRCVALIDAIGPVAIDSWEPRYGRLAEAQVKWEAAAGRPLRGG